MTSRLEDDRKEFVSGQMDYCVKWPNPMVLISTMSKHQKEPLDCCPSTVYAHVLGLGVGCSSCAMVGLHRYNMLNGTNFQFSALLKYNRSMNCVCSYYMTLDALDPCSQLQKTFQVRIDEKSFGDLDLTVSIARIKDEERVTTKKRFIHHFHGEADADDFYQGPLPDWPSVDDLNDRKRFYLVNESELLANDWIHLYLELALYVKDRWIFRTSKPKLQILKVAIETKEDVEPPNGRLHVKSAIFYITYKGMAKPPIGDEIGEDVERKAIVRRVIDEKTGYLTLLGGFSIAKNDLNQSVSGEDQSSDNEQGYGKRRRILYID
ncbi:unnamed protein product [Arabidopsis lyrata]|uniref:Uncharacterized protein n=1 Tax=Arabidopsis lyrata subsp. lyrata TaxID=81972 RepID=D7LA00_ARALL|nr:hypothetical protein ARALYDRAFT_342087 [Arabidopsis lyrata subsp. lyrata]CAH8261064.1 unnamed protein product [Arabidopsis lyrata]